MAAPIKVKVTSKTEYPDTGLVEFSFILKRGDKTYKYKVLPKENAGPFLLESFYNFVKGPGEKEDVDPFTYKNKDKFDIMPEDGKPSKPPDNPEAVQLDLFKCARQLERMSSELASRGMDKAAEMLKPLALRFRKAWMGPKSIAFFDDLGNANIQPEDAMKVLDAYEAGAADGPQIAQMSGIDETVCKRVIELAKKHIFNQ